LGDRNEGKQMGVGSGYGWWREQCMDNEQDKPLSMASSAQILRKKVRRIRYMQDTLFK